MLSQTYSLLLSVNLIQKVTGHKNYNKLIVGINIRAKTIECLEENIGVNLCHFVLGDPFLGMTPKAQMTKEKHRWHFIKMKNFCATINTIKK